jgi:hypothetical protein
MKKIIALTILIMGIMQFSTAQEITCDSIASIANGYLRTNKDVEMKRTFISDGQVYRAFLDEEQVAEFTMTFYGNSTYRISTSAGAKEDYVIFEIYDQDRNLLFTNFDHGNRAYWDFKVESTLECTVEVRLDLDKKLSGCVRMMIGFEKTFK